MSTEYIYQGVWNKWDGHPWTRILTLTNNHAMVVTGLVGVLFAATQVCTWIIIRHVFIRFTQPNRMSDKLDVLSQGEAMKMGFKFIRKLLPGQRPQHSSASPEYEHPYLLGLLALVNIFGFLGAGIVLAWLLTDGALGFTEVRSQETLNCQDRWEKGFPAAVINNNVMLAKSIWERCNDHTNSDSYCDPGFDISNSYKLSVWPICIFQPWICLEGHQTIAFTRSNITAHDLGINSKLKVTVSHRVICSPMSINPFIRQIHLPANDRSGYGNFTFSIQDPRLFNSSQDYDPSQRSGFDINLRTDNGLTSGLQIFGQNYSPSLLLVPGRGANLTREVDEDMHPLLRFSNAQTFVFILKIGSTLYNSTQPIEDPLFAAHTPYQSGLYFADAEATGIACVEQTQVCMEHPNGLKCYRWAKNVGEILPEIVADVRQHSDSHDFLMEYGRTFWKSFKSSDQEHGLQSFLRRQIVLQTPPLLATIAIVDPHRKFIAFNVHFRRQWISELAALFNKYMYWQKLQRRAVVQNTIDHRNDKPYNSPMSICNRVLSMNSDFTNISWTGLWITIGVLLAVCLLSSGVMILEWTLQKKIDLFGKELWQQLKINTGNWIPRAQRGIRSKPHDVHPLELRNRPPVLSEDDPDHPDDPIR